MSREPLQSAGRHAGMGTAEPRGGAGTSRRAVRTRVVAGGVLCGVAAMGLWWAFEQSAAEPQTHFAIARTQLAPGVIVDATDVALVPIRLPAEVSATVFDNRNDVVGGLIVGTVRPGELLARSDVTSPRFAQSAQGGYAVSVELDRPRALNGLLGPGERVDVVATLPPSRSAQLSLPAMPGCSTSTIAPMRSISRQP